ncbi:MAG: hypothetical protein LBF21_02390 [Puniceicoccales bacterium]|jgi:hypothetical protein|nr:hypothetical protein [Puniceicoccales bacterium]
MSSFEVFLYRVSEAGVPHHIPYEPYGEPATLRDLSTQEVANLYWLLETLTVDYHYSINGIGLQRHYVISGTDTPPIQRPKFPSFLLSHMAYDPNYNYPYRGSLHFGTIYQDPAQAGRYGLPLSLYEEDGTGYSLFCLTTAPQHSSLTERIPYDFSFLGKALSLYLYYNPSYVSNPSLDSVTLTASFFSNDA